VQRSEASDKRSISPSGFGALEGETLFISAARFSAQGMAGMSGPENDGESIKCRSSMEFTRSAGIQAAMIDRVSSPKERSGLRADQY